MFRTCWSMCSLFNLFSHSISFFIWYFVTSFCALHVVAIRQFQNEKLNFFPVLCEHIQMKNETNKHTHEHVRAATQTIFLAHIVVCYTHFCEQHTLVFYRISTWHNKRHERMYWILRVREWENGAKQILSNYHPCRFRVNTVHCSIYDYHDEKFANSNKTINKNNIHNNNNNNSRIDWPSGLEKK